MLWSIELWVAMNEPKACFSVTSFASFFFRKILSLYIQLYVPLGGLSERKPINSLLCKCIQNGRRGKQKVPKMQCSHTWHCSSRGVSHDAPFSMFERGKTSSAHFSGVLFTDQPSPSMLHFPLLSYSLDRRLHLLWHWQLVWRMCLTATQMHQSQQHKTFGQLKLLQLLFSMMLHAHSPQNSGRPCSRMLSPPNRHLHCSESRHLSYPSTKAQAVSECTDRRMVLPWMMRSSRFLAQAHFYSTPQFFWNALYLAFPANQSQQTPPVMWKCVQCCI